MPYLMGAPLPIGGGRVPILFDYDFRRLSPGPLSAASLLAETAAWKPNKRGLTFTRASVSTVQTSDTSVNTTPGVNDACIGCRDTTFAHRGLVLQTRTQNIIPGAGRDFSGWNRDNLTICGGDGVLPTRTTGQGGPDGTANATRMQGHPFAFVNVSTGSARPRTLSAWATGNYQMTLTNDVSGCGNTVGSVAAAGNNVGFNRVVLVEGATQTIQLQILDCRTETASGIGGEAATNRDVTVDLAQLEQGTFATEAIISGISSAAGVARDDDKLSYGVGSELISPDNVMRMRFTFTPKFAAGTDRVCYAVTSTSSLTYAAYWWLCSWGALDTNYVRINDTDRKLAVRINGGTEVVSANAFTWSKFDMIVLEIEFGNGVASVARYNRNGGAWNDLALGAVSGTPAPGANPVAIMRDIAASSRTGGHDDDRGQLPCWLHRLTFYGKTPAASQILLTEEGDVLVTDTGQPIVTSV
jgi:hypothetical protein